MPSCSASWWHFIAPSLVRRSALTTWRGRSQTALFAALLLLIVLDEVGGLSSTASAFVSIPVLVALLVILFTGDSRLSLPVSRARQVGFALWCCAVATAVAVGTVIVVHQAPRHTTDHSAYPQGWSLVCVASVALVALLGGLLVFDARTGWLIVTVWSFIGGLLAWLVQEPTYLLSGATRAHGVVGSCIDHHSCAEFAYVAGFIAYGSPLTVAAVFVAAFAAKRVLFRRR